MPRAFDFLPLPVDRDPLQQLATELGKVQPLTALQILQQWISLVEQFILEAILEVTGVDLRDEVATIKMIASIFVGIADAQTEDLQLFARGIRYALQGLDLSNPGAIKSSMDAIVNMVEILVDRMLQALNVPAPVGTVVDKIFDLGDEFDTWFGNTANTAIGLTNLTALFDAGFDASKIVSGAFDLARLPASVLTTASQIAAGALTGTIDLARLPGSVLTAASQLAAANLTGVVPLLTIPNLPLSQMPLLGGYLTNLSPSGLLAPGGLGTGALPVGVTTSISQVAGLASDLATRLTAASPLNAANLTGLMAQGVAPWAAPIDTLMNQFGIAGSGFTGADLAIAMQIGQFGPAQIAANLNSTVQQFGTAMGLVSAGVGDVSNRLAQLFGMATAAKTVGQGAADALAKQAVTQPTYFALDPTAEVSFPLIMQSGSAPTIPLTQANSVGAVISTVKGGIKKSVKWIGDSTANLTGFYISILKINEATGAHDRVHNSGNILVNVSNARAWNVYNLPTETDWIVSEPGFRYVAEFRVTGTGTYNIVGYANSGVPIDTTATAGKHIGTTRAIDTPPSFGSVGAGGTMGAFTNVCNISWAHNVVGNLLIVDLYQTTGGTGALTVKVGATAGAAVAMAQLGSYTITTNWYFQRWYIWNPPQGAQNIYVTGTTSSAQAVAGNSIAYSNASTLGALAGVNGNGTTAAQTVASITPPATIVNTILTLASGTPSAYNRNARAAGAPVAFLFGDTTVNSGSSVGFSATVPSGVWTSASSIVAGIVGPAPATTANPTYSTNVPFVALCGAAGRPQHAPEFWSQNAPGTYTYNVPSWMEKGDWFDIALLSGGAGGFPGGGWGVYGSGGNPGTWQVRSLQYGVDIPLGTTSFSITIGGGGLNGIAGDGSRPTGGGNTSMTISGYGTVTAPGGPPNLFLGGTNQGLGPSPASQTLHDFTAPAGGIQGYSGGNGYGPGGAGAGGQGQTAFGAPGGYGAGGAAWVEAYRI